MKHKIAIGRNHSGFILNESIKKYLLEEYGIYEYWMLERHDRRLIEAIEREFEAGRNPHLHEWGRIKLKEINHTEYYISDYDASESVVTPDKITWIKIE